MFNFRILLCALILWFAFSMQAYAGIEFDNNGILSSELGFPVYSWMDAHRQESGAKPDYIVIAIHGGVLNGLCYQALGEKLAKKGGMLVAPDLRGFGAWYLGNDKFAQNKKVDFKQSQEDLQNLYDKLTDKYPGVPVYWAGESMGACIAVRMANINRATPGGIILSSPAPKQRLFFHPRMLADFALFWTNPWRKMSVRPYVAPRISESPDIRDELANDPKNRYVFSFWELLSMFMYTKNSMSDYQNLPEECNTLILQGDKDRFVRLKDCRRFFAKLPVFNKRMLVFENKGHVHLETVYLEPDVVESVAKVLDNHTLVKKQQLHASAQ